MERDTARHRPGRERHGASPAVTPVSPASVVPLPSEAAIKGTCPALKEAIRLARRAAIAPLGILIHGPSGSGKEQIARLVHEASGRPGAFVEVNCASLSPELAEAEMFGHTRGAFTGAMGERKGLFEAATHGTLFLDEIGEMPLLAQALLLRVLQEGVIRRLGENHTRRVDVRIVAASHRDLLARVAAGLFREDLFYRIADVVVRLPPLRERGRDVLLLARHLVETDPAILALGPVGLGHDAGRVLLAAPWPGNVRQLRSVLRQAAVQAPGGRITREVLDGILGEAEPVDQEVDLRSLIRELGRMSWAQLLLRSGLSRGTLQRRLAELMEQGAIRRVGVGRGIRYEGVEVEGDPEERLRLALELAAREGRLSRGRVAEALGVSARTATRVLGALVERGWIEALEGGGRSQAYRLSAGASEPGARVGRGAGANRGRRD